MRSPATLFICVMLGLGSGSVDALAAGDAENEAPPALESALEAADTPTESPGGPGSTPSTDVVAVRATPEARLDAAVRSYQFGEADAARGQFAALVIDDGTPVPVRQEARVYLGELLYIAGDREEARRFFEQTLDQEPDYAVDAFRHPPEVVDYFNYVRAFRTMPPTSAPAPSPLPPAPTLVPPSPVSTMVGHGVYHFRYGQPRRGALYVGLQGSFLAVEAVLWGSLLSDRTYQEGDEARLQQLSRRRTLTGVAAAGYWGTWLASVLDANAHWRQVEGPSRARAASASALAPVRVHGTF